MGKLPRLPDFRLDGKRALVIGASRGIGLGCATALAGAGAHVILVARGGDALRDAAEAMTREGWSAEPMVLDVCDVDAVRAAIAQLAPLDIFVNSAGTARHAPALETTPEDFDAVMDLNFRAAFFLTQAAAAAMQDHGGSIINISSQMGHVGGIDRAVYCASKHAVEGMTKAMAIDFGSKRIRVNTICPTFVRTPLTESTFANPDQVSWIEEKIKLGRIGEVEDIMGATVFLASDAASLITGTALMVDGGWTAG